ncbi:MAG: holin family protein, partial [Pseudomonadota bacterium]
MNISRTLPGLARIAAALAPAPGGARATGRFGRTVDGLNRLPRPLFGFGVFALFIYAMADPAGFAARMVGLRAVPEPLWWLIGAVVSFHFGARELHHLRNRPKAEEPPFPPGLR